MKRFVGLVLVGVFVLGVSISHSVLAHDEGSSGADGVTVCHITKSFVRDNGNVSFFGHVIIIPLPDVGHSVEAHTGHGDLILEGEGATEGACCSFCLTLNGRSCGLD